MTTTLNFFKRGSVARDIRLEAARGAIDAPSGEVLAILVLLTTDEDEAVRTAACETLEALPEEAVRGHLEGNEIPDEVRAYFVSKWSDEDLDPELTAESDIDREGMLQKLARMTFPQRLKAASKGSREVRAVLIRDPSKSIAMAALNSPKVTEQEVETFARMGNVGEDILRAIATRRAWLKNYGVVVALTKNAKTPLALSLNLMNRLNDRDLAMLSNDRNVPEPLRIAARKRVVGPASR